MFPVLVFFVAAIFTPAHVIADIGTVLVQDSVHHNQFGFFSTHFIGVRLDSNNRALVNFVAGDEAADDYVLSLETRTQSDSFFQNTVSLTFLSSGTWWVYLAAYGTILNWDYVQIRIVDNSWTGEITPKFQNPPFTWRYGYPPYGVPFTSDDASASDGTVATLPNPTLTSIPSSHRSSTTSSTSISVWLAPLLVGIIMFAITVPIVIIAYKKGKQHAKQTQVKMEEGTENQQKNQQNRVQV